MGIQDIASVSVLIAGAAQPTVQGFGTPLLAAYFDPTTHWQGSYDVVRFYPSATALTQLVTDGFKIGGQVYRAFEVALAQSPCPPLIGLGRRALPPTQVLKLTCLSTVVGQKYAATFIGADGVEVTNTLTSTGVPATDAAAYAALLTAETPSGSAASLTYAGGVVTLTGGSGFSSGNVGEQIVISNSTTPANNGTFTIATYISSSSVTFANASGAADASGAVHFAVGPKIGTVTVSMATITITQAPGSLTDILNWTPGIFSVANTTSDPGIATDLAAILTANNLGWYGLSLDSNSLAEVKAAAQWVEATGQGGKWGFFDNADTANVASGSGDLDSQLEALSLMKSYVQQSDSQVLCSSGFGMASKILAQYPGSYQVAFQNLANVVADNDQTMTETQQLILNSCSTSTPGTGGKNGNWYKTVSGLSFAFPGVTPGGRWVDQGIFADWLQANVQADVLAVFAGPLGKVPLTDIGIGLVGAAIKSRLKTGSLPPYGGIDPTRPIVVNLPTAASMSTQDRNNRNISGITASFYFTGAAVSTEITITGSP